MGVEEVQLMGQELVCSERQGCQGEAVGIVVLCGTHHQSDGQRESFWQGPLERHVSCLWVQLEIGVLGGICRTMKWDFKIGSSKLKHGTQI